ncbi:hypothetical protein Hanom_Chr16g01468191 [Helianthus anomalus]
MSSVPTGGDTESSRIPQENFFRIKHAYNTVLNSDSKKKYDSGNRASQTYNYKPAEADEFYGFGNFLRDVQISLGRYTSFFTNIVKYKFLPFSAKINLLQNKIYVIMFLKSKFVCYRLTRDFLKDLQEENRKWEVSAPSEAKPKSSWEDLAEIEEEFVEYLEKELNITDTGDETKSRYEKPAALGKGRKGNGSGNEGSKGSNIEDNIDEIEATFAQLKRELGL